MRIIFSTVRAPQDPAFTVESLAMIATGRPCTRPMPVTTPSDGRSPAVALASRPSSMKSLPPSSQSSAIRSRQNSLPAAALLSWYFAVPPLRTLSARESSSSLRDIDVSLSSFENGRAFLGEGGQRLVAVLAGQHFFVADRLQRQSVGERQVDAAVDGTFGGAGRQRTGGGDFRGQPRRRSRELARWNHLGDQPEGQRPG